eukprot:m.47100 g.47100  ORF g.47100 m.47100 type:complete len:763 (+) comp11900_c0_seq1:732-3020(+)
MTAFALSADILGVLALTLYLVRKYGNPWQSIAVTTVVVITWFFSFVIVLVLPLDVSATFYWDCVTTAYCRDPVYGGPTTTAAPTTTSFMNFSNTTTTTATTTTTPIPAWSCSRLEFCDLPTNLTCQPEDPGLAEQFCQQSSQCHCEQPWSYVSYRTLPTFWAFVYWSSQALTWLVLPMMESYMSAGDFTFVQKVKSAVKENLLVYASAGLIFFVLFLYIAIKNHLDAAGIRSIAIAASNTWGLLMLVVMLGYGLVDVPRFLWRRSNRTYTLRLYQFRAAKLSAELADARDKLDIVHDEVRSTAGQILQGDSLRPYINQILSKCSDFEQRIDTYQDFTSSADGELRHTRSSLAKLHRKLIKAQRVLHRCKCQWDHLLEKTFELEDVIKNVGSPDHKFKHTFAANAYTGPFHQHWPTIEWYWKVKIRPWVFLFMAIVGTAFSLALVWSEVTFSSESPTLSVYALAIKYAGNSQQYFNLELMTFLTLFYLCTCAYRVIFKLRVFNFYYLVPHQQTDSSSLLFSAMFLSRLTAPLCLNFLALAHLDNHVTKHNMIEQPTAFTKTMGHMDVVAFMRNFNTYYPMLILVISFGSLFKLGSRCLGLFGIQSFVADDEDAEEFVNEGKTLLSREKRQRLKDLRGGGPRISDRPMSTRVASIAKYLPGARNDDDDTGLDRRTSVDNIPALSRGAKASNKASASASSSSRFNFSFKPLTSLFSSTSTDDADDQEELLPTTTSTAMSRLNRMTARNGGGGGGGSGRKGLFDDL